MDYFVRAETYVRCLLYSINVIDCQWKGFGAREKRLLFFQPTDQTFNDLLELFALINKPM